MRGKKGSSELASCRGCGGTEPIWKAARSGSFDPETRSFRHGKVECNERDVVINGTRIHGVEVATERAIQFQVFCNDRQSVRCSGSWFVTAGELRSAAGKFDADRKKPVRHKSFELIDGNPHWTCGPCRRKRVVHSPRREEAALAAQLHAGGHKKRLAQQRAKALLDGARSEDDESIDDLKGERRHIFDRTIGSTADGRALVTRRGARATRPNASLVKVQAVRLSGVLQQCRLCETWLYSPAAVPVPMHPVCRLTWMRYDGHYLRRAPRDPGTGRLVRRGRRHLATARWPAAESRRGHPVDPEVAMRGLRCLMIQDAMVRDEKGQWYLATDTKLAELEHTSRQNIRASRESFLERAPGTWDLVFRGGAAKGNDVRQRRVPLPGSLRNTKTREQTVRSLAAYGMAPEQIAQLVGWAVEDIRVAAAAQIEAEAARREREQTGRRRIRQSRVNARRRGDYTQRKASGLCVEARCDEPRLDGKTRCDQHLDALRERGRRSRGARTCRKCHEILPLSGHKLQYHPWCKAESEKRRRSTPQARTNRAAAVRRYEEQHRKAGLCLKCSQTAVPGQVLCDTHRDALRARRGSTPAAAAQ